MSKRRELELQRQAGQRRQNMMVMGMVLAGTVVLIGGALVLNQANPPANTPAAAASLPSASLGLSAKPSPPNAEKGGRAWGPVDAPIKIVEFIDYQCPACGQYAKTYDKPVIDAFAATGKVRWEYATLNFIDSFQPGSQESRDAAAASWCATDQDKFWQMHYAIFDKQTGENRGGFARPRLKEMARAIGLNGDTFDACLDSNKYATKVDESSTVAREKNISSTPSFVVNGKVYPGFQSVTDFRRIFSEIAPGIGP